MRIFLSGLLLLGLFGCSPKAIITKTLTETQTRFQDHTGFVLYDPVAEKTLIDFNGASYFIPASNTKIFTFYTSLKLLGDSITGLYYQHRNDSLILWSSGDPSLLYRNVFQNNRVYDFLKNSNQKVFLANSPTDVTHLGPGWAWNDYFYPYGSERSAFPIYGNLVLITKATDSTIHTHPSFFMEHLVHSTQKRKREEIIRDLDSNQLTYYSGEKNRTQEWEVPFHTSSDLIVELLSDTLKKVVEEITIPFSKERSAFKSIPADSLYKVMMQESDNFIAEQLLLMNAAAVSDTLSPEIGIRYAIKNLLNDLPDKPVWVDGSGLSRYNLFTPRTIVKLWDKIGREVPRERLFQLLAVGGKTGTIKNWYAMEPPFIYAKTGTLSNNHALSGYLITKKGKTFIFSFMNNNFTVSATEVRRQMDKILRMVHEKY